MPLIVIVGPTASGKSAAALTTAKKYGGEIICADSRTVYKGMDIGTAKPTAAQQQEIPHHLLDIIEPSQEFSAADYKKRAVAAIEDVVQRGKIPILVGGTGLYIDSVLFDFQFTAKSDPAQRQRLNNLSVIELKREIQALGLALPVNSSNPRHLVRTIESGGAKPQKQQLRSNTLVFGMAVDREDLGIRISARIETMIAEGLELEAEKLFDRYGRNCSSLQTIGYQEWLPYFDKKISHEQVVQNIEVATRRYAKRQMTWFKRNKSIHWVSKQIEIDDLITTFLNK